MCPRCPRNSQTLTFVRNNPDTSSNASGAEAVDCPGSNTRALSNKSIEDAAVLAKDTIDEGGQIGECSEHQEITDEVGT